MTVARTILIGTLNRRRIMTDLIVIPLAVYAGLALYAHWRADRLLFQPQPSSYGHEDDLLTIVTADGERLRCVHLANPQATLTVLHSHGNAEDLGDIRDQLETLRDLGFAVFAYDYRGYGLSTGTPSSQGVCRDIEAAYDHLTGVLGVPPERIVVHGRSVGGGPTVHLASTRPVGGLILESTFTSAFVVMTRIPLFPFDRFRNLAGLAEVTCPVLVLHGTDDEIIPFRHGLKLYEAARGHKRYLWLEGVGHNTFPGPYEEAYRAALTEFAALVAGLAAP